MRPIRTRDREPSQVVLRSGNPISFREFTRKRRRDHRDHHRRRGAVPVAALLRPGLTSAGMTWSFDAAHVLCRRAPVGGSGFQARGPHHLADRRRVPSRRVRAVGELLLQQRVEPGGGPPRTRSSGLCMNAIWTSAASNSLTPSMSPSRSASKNRAASFSRSRWSASNRGRPTSMWCRAGTASWRHAASDRPTATATSGRPNPNTFRSATGASAPPWSRDEPGCRGCAVSLAGPAGRGRCGRAASSRCPRARRCGSARRTGRVC